MVQLSLLLSSLLLLLLEFTAAAAAAAGGTATLDQGGKHAIRLRLRRGIEILLQDQLIKQDQNTTSHLRRKKEQHQQRQQQKQRRDQHQEQAQHQGQQEQQEPFLYGRHNSARPLEHRKLQLAPDDTVILNDYIVEVDPLNVTNLTALAEQWTKQFNGDAVGYGRAIIKQRYHNALYGIRIVLYNDNNNNYPNNNNITAEEKLAVFAQPWRYSESVLMNLLADDKVLSVEENQIATVLKETSSTLQTTAARLRTQATDQGRWGLNYLDWPVSDQQYTWTFNGSGVHVYIVDSGMELDHDEFDNGARSSCAYEVVRNSKGPCYDGHSHGTHVAGIVGGKTVGVAKAVMLHSVKVLGNSGMGTMAEVADGIDWVVAQKQGSLSNQKMIMNLSVGGSKSIVLNKAVRNAVKSGLLVVGAAANSGRDACNSSPGAVTNALIVGAMEESETIASFSNYGPCVDLWAPGVGIESAANLGPSSYMSKSGTSQAAPFVAGLAALYMQKLGSSATANTAVAALLADARVVPSMAARKDGSPDLVAYSGVVNGEQQQPPFDTQTVQDSNIDNGSQNNSSSNNNSSNSSGNNTNTNNGNNTNNNKNNDNNNQNSGSGNGNNSNKNNNNNNNNNKNNKKNNNNKSNAASSSEMSAGSSSSCGQNNIGKLTMMKLIYGVGGSRLDDRDHPDRLEKQSASSDGQQNT